tara:strand:- start:562 stop:936 length:375 start_codon:yes stop_codon:yes gene_type:complete
VQFIGPDFDEADRILQRNSILELDGALAAEARLEAAGLILDISDGVARVEEPFPGTPLFQELGDFDFYADKPVTLEALFAETADRPARALFYLPFLAAYAVIIFAQRRRQLEVASPVRGRRDAK